MARGKHGQAASVRHEVQSRDAEIATYQRRVAQLTADNRTLRDQLRGEQQRHHEVERELRARLSEGAAPEVEALSIRLRETQHERDEAWEHVKNFSEQTDSASDLLMDLLVAVNGWDEDRARERCHEILPWRTGRLWGRPRTVINCRGMPAFGGADTTNVGIPKLWARATNGDRDALEQLRKIVNARTYRMSPVARRNFGTG